MTTGERIARGTPGARILAAVAMAVLGAVPRAAHASLFQGETLDAVADGASWVVLVVGPIVAIVVFWLVHIIPEKIAEKKHHPQAKAIQALCLLSLVFGGLLWPVAMLWAVTRPVLHKAAYGTDRLHPEHGDLPPDPVPALPPADDPVRRLRADLDAYGPSNPPTPEQVQDLRARLAALEATSPPAVPT